MRHSQFDLALHRGGGWKVNGDVIDEEVTEFLDDRTAFEFETWLPSACPYCRVSFGQSRFVDTDFATEQWHYNREYLLSWCPRCAHWQFAGGESGNRCMDAGYVVIANSIAARFEPTLPEGCPTELAQHLRRHPRLWHEIAPARLEMLVADIFRANYRHVEVAHVGRPGDRGVDVVFVDDHHTRWLIQVKRRERASRSEGFSTLQSILGTLALKGDRHGIIVTTADSFSHQAQADTAAARSQGFHVELLNKDSLDRMLDPLLPKSPWRALLEHAALSYLKEDVVSHFGGNEYQMDLFDQPGSFPVEVPQIAG